MSKQREALILAREAFEHLAEQHECSDSFDANFNEGGVAFTAYLAVKEALDDA